MIGFPRRRLERAAALAVLALAAGCASEPRYPIHEGEPVGEAGRPLVPAYPINPGLRAPSEAAPPPGLDSAPPQRPLSETSVPYAASPHRAAWAAIKPSQVRTRRTPDTVSYTVAKGDTLYGVARRFALAPAKIAAANRLSATAGLRPGAYLSIPAAARDAGEQAHAAGVARRTPGQLITLVGAGVERRRPPAPASVESPPLASESERAPNRGPVPYTKLIGAKPPRGERQPRTASAAAASVAAAPSFGQVAISPTAALDGRAVSLAGQGRFIRPVIGATLSSFGDKGPGQRNDGVDLAAREGEAVRAAASGVVVYAGHDVPALGNLVAIKHDDGWVTVYGNLEKITVHPAEHLSQGAEVGVAGATSVTPRAQVHFEVRYAPDPAEKARPVDPELVLPKAG